MKTLVEAFESELSGDIDCIYAYPFSPLQAPINERMVVFEKTKTQSISLVGQLGRQSTWTMTVFVPESESDDCIDFAREMSALLMSCDTRGIILSLSLGTCSYDKNKFALKCVATIVLCGETKE